MPTKKADMSLALIVAAVIALIVIVVALTIFGKGTGDSEKHCRAVGLGVGNANLPQLARSVARQYLMWTVNLGLYAA